MMSSSGLARTERFVLVLGGLVLESTFFWRRREDNILKNGRIWINIYGDICVWEKAQRH